MTRAVQISVIGLCILAGYILWLRFFPSRQPDSIKELEALKQAIVTKDSLDRIRYNQVIDSIEVLKVELLHRYQSIEKYTHEIAARNEKDKKHYYRNRDQFVNRPEF